MRLLAFMRTVVVALLTFPGPVLAQSSGRERRPPQVVEGVVREEGTRTPIEGAVVTFHGGATRVSAVTDANGRYRLRRTAASAVAVTVHRMGYRTLHLDGMSVWAGVSVDFVLTAHALALAPLTVNGTRRPEGDEISVSGAGNLTERSTEAFRMAVAPNGSPPFAMALQATATQPDEGRAPLPTGVTPIGGMRVRGPLHRHGATFVDGAPTLHASSLSSLADPFTAVSGTFRVQDAGAPARVTGGLEYVAEIEGRPGDTRRVGAWEVSADLVRIRSDGHWRTDAMAMDVSVGAMTPWIGGLLREPGHRSRRGRLVVWSAPSRAQRLTLASTLRDEALPIGLSSGAAASVKEATWSARWNLAIGGGVLEARVAAALATTALPNPGSDASQDAGFVVGQDRSRAGFEYRGTVGAGATASIGVDRLGYTWRGSAVAEGTAWGVYSDARFEPHPGVAVRVGGRLDRLEERTAVSPRARLDVDVGHGIHLAAGVGVHRQLLLRGAELPPGRDRGVVAATGLHHRAGVTFEGPALSVRLGAFAKKLRDIPGVGGDLHVRGVEGTLAVLPGGRGMIEAGAVLEHRKEGAVGRWTIGPWMALGLSGPVGVRIRARVEAAQGVGGLLVPAGSADTLGLFSGGPSTVIVDPGDPWDVRADLELDRVFPGGGSSGRPTLLAYVQVLNIARMAQRPLVASPQDENDVLLPRTLVVGFRVSTNRARP